MADRRTKIKLKKVLCETIDGEEIVNVNHVTVGNKLFLLVATTKRIYYYKCVIDD